jgi:proline iminopeptidase
VSRGTWTAGRPRPVADLIDSTHVVHRYDQRGCGWSTGPDDYRLARAIADLDALRASWGRERWTVFGHSWGATLALAYAWTHPERTRPSSTAAVSDRARPGGRPTAPRAPGGPFPPRRSRLADLEDRDPTWEEEMDYRPR